MDAAIIGGGAAGFFLAIRLRRLRPDMSVTIFERAPKVLAKVKVSGGGRCNVTNSFAGIKDLVHVYPRGHRLMKRLLREFGPQDTFQWFEDNGVPLVTQEDECVFPRSQNSESIILCLRRAAADAGVEVLTAHAVRKVKEGIGGRLEVDFGDAHAARTFDLVALTSGGAPHGEGHDWLAATGHKIAPPCPSLFTFNLNDKGLTALTGIVVKEASAAIAGTKMRASGPLLITHWGVSGPAILKLSSYAARRLHERGYKDRLLISWCGDSNAENVAEYLRELLAATPRKQLGTLRPFGLQGRLWNHLLQRAGLSPEKPCAETGNKGLHRLTTILTADNYDIAGRCTYRDEFVTCGGVSLDSVSAQTLESRHLPGLYFAGEVLDIDAVTGGFNFQAAWTTACVAAQAMAQRTEGI